MHAPRPGRGCLLLSTSHAAHPGSAGFCHITSGSHTERPKTWHQLPALRLPCSVILGKSLSLSRPQTPCLMLPSLLGFHGLMPQTKREVNTLGRWFLGQCL